MTRDAASPSIGAVWRSQLYAIPADSFAQVVAFAMSQPASVDINEILFRPTRQEL
jgi:NADP-dependent 3-hydroxy acid dehydrogenase YdfG